MARTSRKQKLGEKNGSGEQAPRWSAGLYVRISVESERKRESDTIGTQIQLLRNYVSEKPDIAVYDIYNDDDLSGADYDRPEFARMMNDVRNRNVNCIIVKDLSRLGRNTLETGEYIEMVFPFFQVRFIAVNDHFDSAEQQADLGVQIKNFANERYARDIARKIVSAKRVVRAQGKYDGGRVPYGYRIDPNDRHRLIIDEETAPVVSEIFDQMERGVTLRRIAVSLNERGIPSPGKVLYDRGVVKKESFASSQWYMPTIKRILQNHTYLGWTVSGKVRSLYSEGGQKKNIPMQPEQWNVIKGSHEPIITEEQFERIAAMLEENRKGSGQANDYDCEGRRNNIFRGHLRCGECGKSMALRRKKNGNGTVEEWYFCPMHEHYNSRYCKKKAVKRKSVDEITLRILQSYMRTILERSSAIMHLNNSARGKTHYRAYLRAIERTKADIELCMRRKAELYADFADGILTKEEYLSLGQEYAQRADELRVQLYDQERDARKYAPDYALDGTLADLIKKYIDVPCLDELMIQALIDTVTLYNDGHIEVSVKFRNVWAEVDYIWEVRKNDAELLERQKNAGLLPETV